MVHSFIVLQHVCICTKKNIKSNSLVGVYCSLSFSVAAIVNDEMQIPASLQCWQIIHTKIVPGFQIKR